MRGLLIAGLPGRFLVPKVLVGITQGTCHILAWHIVATGLASMLCISIP